MFNSYKFMLDLNRFSLELILARGKPSTQMVPDRVT